MQQLIIKYWPSSNWGDVANFELVRHISGILPRFVSVYDTKIQILHYSVMGSILRFADTYTIVWGSGFLSSADKCRQKPKKVCCVRGPLSHDKLLKHDIECPDIYGDPAILWPLYYKPAINKKYKLGIIPHWKDYHNNKFNINEKDILLIRPFGIKNAASVYEYIDKICSCDSIASASLHGLIIADAYKIPNVRIYFDKNKLDDFKFDDYSYSVDRNIKEPISCSDKIDYDKLISSSEYSVKNLNQLQILHSCPFKKEENEDNTAKR